MTNGDDRATRYNPPPAASDDRATRIAPPQSPADDRETRISPPPDISLRTLPPSPPAASSPTAPRGSYAVGDKILGGQFELIEQLRGGAQARAYKGRAFDGSEVFVKIQLNPTRRADTFAKQIELRPKLLGMAHPNLLRCLAFDLNDGDLCEVYEFVHGQSLEDRLQQGTLDDAAVRLLLGHLAEGIHAMHASAGLIHRDLKPANIMFVGERGRAPLFRIVDYGVVSQIDTGGLTTIAGTVKYSPPERMLRYLENSEQARAWDWWTIGRIVQEAVDGAHPYELLDAVFPEEFVRVVKKVRDPRAAHEHLFDEIQREGAMEKYRMHAGMVELSERKPRARPWLPLLKGLLTFNRDRRWGYGEVTAFLRGETVPEFYAERRSANAQEVYEDPQGNEWESIAKYAARLAADAQQQPPGEGNTAWQLARQQVFKGQFQRHVSSVMHDAEMAQKLARCVWLDPQQREQGHWDADLGTALALMLIADGGIPRPNICGLAIDADYLRYLAASTEPQMDETVEQRIRGLLSEPFAKLLAEVTPAAYRPAVDEALRQIAALRAQIDTLHQRADLLGIHYPRAQLRSQPSAMVRLVSQSAQDDARVIDTQYRVKLGETRNVRLQALYGSKHLDRLEPLDLKALRLGLLYFQDNEFETHEATAMRAQNAARQLRLADALQRASHRLWQPKRWRWTLLVAALAALVMGADAAIDVAARLPFALDARQLFELIVAQASAPSGPRAGLDPRLVTILSHMPWAAIGTLALAFGLLWITLLRALRPNTVADVDRLKVVQLGGMVAPSAQAAAARKTALSLVGDVPGSKPGSYGSRLATLNARIRALPGIEHKRFVVRPVTLWRSNGVLLLALVATSLPFAAGPLSRAFSSDPGASTYGWLNTRLGLHDPRLPAQRERFTIGGRDAIGGGGVGDYRYPAIVSSATRIGSGAQACRVPAGQPVFATEAPMGRTRAVVALPADLCPDLPSRLVRLPIEPPKTPRN